MPTNSTTAAIVLTMLALAYALDRRAERDQDKGDDLTE